MVRSQLRSPNETGQAARKAKRFRRGRPGKASMLAVGTAIAAVGILAVSTVGPPTREASADPMTVLTLAGRAAAKQPDVVPRPDQYWYVAESGGYQAWLSMDGTHDGLVISNGQRITVPGCRNGTPAAVGGAHGSSPCVADPAYLADAPGDTAAMKRYLSTRLHGDSDPNRVGKEIAALLEFRYLRPGARAALFRAAGTSAGIRLRAPGSAGVPANQVAVGWTHAGGAVSLVFDAYTHDFIGVMTTADASVGVAAPAFGIVDHVEQLP